MTALRDIQKRVDPCKQFTNYDYGLLVTAMGLLPRCIDLNSDVALLAQVTEACNVMHVLDYQFKEAFVDNNGTHFLCGVGEVFAIGVMSRMSKGDWEAIYFYKDGQVIVEDRGKLFRFYMKG